VVQTRRICRGMAWYRWLVGAGLLFVAAQVLAAETYTGKVIAIADGDTLTILTERRRQVKVRLAEIDTPERGQPYGARAKQALAVLAFGKTARVEQQDVDRYGRVVGRVYVDGMDVNAEMVRRGYAWVYRRYARDESLFDLEREARSADRGIWAMEHPVPSWEWRNRRRAGSASSGFGSAAGRDRDCSDFSTWREAQAFFEAAGPGDPHRLRIPGKLISRSGAK